MRIVRPKELSLHLAAPEKNGQQLSPSPGQATAAPQTQLKRPARTRVASPPQPSALQIDLLHRALAAPSALPGARRPAPQTPLSSESTAEQRIDAMLALLIELQPLSERIAAHRGSGGRA